MHQPEPCGGYHDTAWAGNLTPSFLTRLALAGPSIVPVPSGPPKDARMSSSNRHLLPVEDTKALEPRGIWGGAHSIPLGTALL